MLLALPFLCAAAVTIEPGLYTLKELCAHLPTVTVTGPEADAIYAVSLKDAKPEDAVAALVATGRVTAVRSENGVILRRDPEADKLANQQAQKVREGIRDRLSGFRFLEMQRIKALAKASEQDRDAEIERLRNDRSDRLSVQMADDLYAYFGNELPYPAIAAQMTSLTIYSHFPSPMFVMSAATMPQVFSPAADVTSDPYFRTAFPANATTEEKQAALKTMEMGTRWSYDPATHAVSFRLVWCDPSNKSLPFGRIADPLPLSHLILPRPDPLVDVLLPNDPAKVVVPPGPRRLTERLLDCATRSGTGLVAYVGGFSDRWLPTTEESGISASISMANVGAFDGVEERERASRRGVALAMPSSRGCRLRLAFSNGIAVVSDGRDYLNAFQAPGWEVPTELLNRSYQRLPISLAALNAAVAKISIPDGKGLPFPERWLPWCDPAAQYPFARLLNRLPEDAEKIDHLAPATTHRILLKSLDGHAKTEFQEALGRCQQVADDIRDITPDPAVALQALRRFSNGTEAVTVRRLEKGYEFKLEAPQGVLWRSTVRLTP